MVKKAIDAAETLARFPPRMCSLSHAVIVVGSFALAGFIGGLSIGLYLLP